MGRESKSIQLQRLSALSDKMKENLNYHDCLIWYVNQFGKSEGMFQKDRTAVYKQWKESLSKDMEIHLINILNKIEEDRELARGLGNAGAAIQANKLEAQLRGLLNKQGEVHVEQTYIDKQLNVDFSNYSFEELKKLLND